MGVISNQGIYLKVLIPIIKIIKIMSKLPNPFQEQQHYPDAKLHQLMSFIKSAIRIVGYVLIPINILSAAIVLVLSEIIGIIEELV